MDSYHDYVRKLAGLLGSAKSLTPGEAEFPDESPVSSNAPVAMIFAPHPDDECIMGGLALRLARESGFRVINVPVTYGSRLDRRAERKKELAEACRYLGFEIEPASEEGLEQITPEERESDADNWERAVGIARGLIDLHRPRIIFFPHEMDGHPTHCGTGLLVAEALQKMPHDFSCILAETEYWHPMESPNLMVELDERTVGDLVTALSFHKGEVSRNPFHLTFPAWLVDNVRRGSEVVGTPGAAGKDFVFAALFRISVLKDGEFFVLKNEVRFVSSNESPSDLFEE